jgi:hypothetical protein
MEILILRKTKKNFKYEHLSFLKHIIKTKELFDVIAICCTIERHKLKKRLCQNVKMFDTHFDQVFRRYGIRSSTTLMRVTSASEIWRSRNLIFRTFTFRHLRGKICLSASTICFGKKVYLFL